MMKSEDDEVTIRMPVKASDGHSLNGLASHDSSMLRKFSHPDILSERKISLSKGPERKISTNKGPERKISSSKGPERKLSAAVDPLYVHLNEDVDESEEEDDVEYYGNSAAADPYDLDDDYCEESKTVGCHCCEEARFNWTRFYREAKKQARELREASKKIDVKKYLRGCCSMELLKNRLPILKWAPKYNLQDLQGDLIAGTTVGLTVIPQSIAYAFIAGVPAQYGLYSAFIGSFVYVIFGSSKDITLGPSAVSSLLTALFATSPIEKDASVAIVMAFFCGIICLVMGIFGLGRFMDFISYPVLKGFTSAAAITIAMSQVKKWWGERGVPREFLPQLQSTLLKIPEARLWDFLLGFCCIIMIVFLKKLKEVKWKTEWDDLTIGWKIVNKFIWVLGTGRNIVAIVLASVAAYIFLEHGLRPFSLTGDIPPGIPPFRPPPFTVHDDKTNKTLTLTDMSNIIGAGYIIVPVLALIEAMAIGNVFARRFDYRIDPNQEFICYGIGNILTAFFSGYPITGTFSRTAVNAQSGVRTQAGGIMTGAIVLIALQFLTPLFYYIPEASLAVVIILAVNDMITFHKLWIFWKTRKIDLIPWLVTFIVSFAFSIAYGVIIGAGVSILLLLYPACRPKIKAVQYSASELIGSVDGHLVESNSTIVIAKFYSGLLYPAIEYTRDKIIPLYSKEPLPKGVIIDFHHVSVIDTTTVQGIRLLLESFNKKKIQVVFCNLRKSVNEILTRSKPKFFKKADTVENAARMILDLEASLPESKAPATIRKRRDNNNTQNQEEMVRKLHGQLNPAFDSTNEPNETK